MSERDVTIIDFHSHYFEPEWRRDPPTTLGSAPRAWPLLNDLEGQLAALATAGIDGKVLTAPAANLLPPGESLDPAMIREMNDTLADHVAGHPGRLYALGTIDAFQGTRAAREVERVVCLLGLGGIVIDCARDGELLDSPAARPTLEAAAALGALVFVHPVSPAGLTERLGRLGSSGVLMARGLEASASILALLRSGILDELPDLRVVIPAIAASALTFAVFADWEHGRDARWSNSRPSTARKRLYIDTMGLDPALIRYSIDLLGIEHVLFGTDWPIMPLNSRRQILAALTAAGVTTRQEQEAILSGNLLQLLSRCLRPGRDRPAPPLPGRISDLLDREMPPPAVQAGAAEWDWVVR